MLINSLIKDLEINSNTNKLVKEKTNQLSSFLKGIKLKQMQLNYK